MKKIALTQGKFALVDDSDFEWLNQWKWQAHKTHSGTYEVTRTDYSNDQKKTIRMSRQIMSCPQRLQVDHKDHNILNNQKSNLRICTNIENSRNGKKHKNNTSGIKGVNWHKGSIYKGKQYNGKWEARIGFNYKRICLGSFNTKKEATFAYNKAAIKYFGEFAYEEDISRER